MQIENNSGTIYDEPLLTLRSSYLNGTTTNPVIAFKGEDTLYAIMGYDFSTKDIVLSTQIAGITPDLIINHDNGFTGLNTKTPTSQLDVNGSGNVRGDLTVTGTRGLGDLFFTYYQQGIRFPTFGATASNSAMIYMTGSPTQNARMVLAHSKSFPDWGLQYDDADDQFNFLGAGSNKFSIDLSSGGVGVGIANPAEKFEVNGTSRFYGNIGVQTAPTSKTIQCGSTQGALIGIGTAEYIQDAGSSTLSFAAHLVPTGDGFYTLGNSAFRWNNVWAMDGTINTSDARDKTNIRDLNYGLKDIMKLHAVKFNWKNNADEDDKLGVIAQEIQKVLPEVVRDWDYNIDEKTGAKTKVPSQKLGVMYADIIPVLIKGMQEQQKEIEELKQIVQQLTNNNLSGNQNTTGNNAIANNKVAGNADVLQNIPNPVKNSTVISYSIKNNYKNAQLIVTDNNGKTIKIFVINNQSGKIIFDASALTAGTYYYSLMTDDKMVATKTMMITK